jgi:hypothetical protein
MKYKKDVKTVLNFRTKEQYRCNVLKLNRGCETEYSFGHWKCGYIYVSIINYKYIDSSKLNVHGGTTYESYSGDKKYIVFGFDCAHYDDSPIYIPRPRSTGYCKNELIHLSKQINKMILSGRKRMIKNKIKLIKELIK